MYNKKGGFAIQKHLFLKNGLIMAASALIIRTMNIFFRVFMADSMGAEGIGLYQLIISVYLFFAAISTSGISLTATRSFSDFSARGELSKAKYSVNKCLVISIILGGVLGTVMYFSADCAGEYFLHDVRTVPALKLLAPSLPFMAASACVRGYFTARRQTIQTSVEQLLEQVIEMGVFAVSFAVLKPDTLEKACCTAVLGTTAAEVISFIYSMICYYFDIRKLHCQSERTDRLARKIISVAVPVMANSCLRTGLSAVENVLIPIGLKKNGSDTSNALAQYGTINGMVMPVLVFPTVFILPFASLIITEMSENLAKKHLKSIKYISSKMFKLTLVYSLPVMVIFIFFGKSICETLYHNSNAGIFLSMLAPVVPFMYLDCVVDGILKGLNEQTSYLIFNLIDAVIRVILTYILLPKFGIFGIVAVIIVSELLNTVMSIARLIKVTAIKIKVFEWVIFPLMSIVTPCLLMKFFSVDFTVKIVICLAFYGTSLLIFSRKNSGQPLKS